jgi:hypothetical protein
MVVGAETTTPTPSPTLDRFNLGLAPVMGTELGRRSDFIVDSSQSFDHAREQVRDNESFLL